MATTPTPAAPATATARPSVIQLSIKEKAALYAAYMSPFPEGGIFVPTNRAYQLGDDVYLLLTIMEDPQRYPIAGKVAWITPANAQGSRPQGIGVRFPADDKSKVLRVKIEEILGANLGSSRPTHTM